MAYCGLQRDAIGARPALLHLILGILGVGVALGGCDSGARATGATVQPDNGMHKDAAGDADVPEESADAQSLETPKEDDTVLEAGDAGPGPDASADVAGSDGDAASMPCKCGDGLCNNATACAENILKCPADCAASCGDTVCSPGEGPKNCAADCCGGCGDGKCTGYECGENSVTCAKDCGTACGNQTCDKGESPSTCAEDCAWKVCGNHKCDGGESPEICPEDCAAACGDCKCQGSENFDNCPVDCGWCGDGVCSNCALAGENTETCANDCSYKECNAKFKGPQCHDGEPCTYDTCGDNGSCLHHPVEAVNLVLVATCTDANDCTGLDHCQGGSCAPGKAVECDDGMPCSFDFCVAQGGCQHDAQPMNGTKCSDGSLCTKGDSCMQGTCLGQAVSCDDGSPCTDDDCDPTVACTHMPAAPTACDDGNACTTSDACGGGWCKPGKVKSCDDKNFCTVDSCDPAEGCVVDPAQKYGDACDDGNACTSGDACSGGGCVGGLLDCNDNNGCTADACKPVAGCVHLSLDGTPCDDGSVCTVSDACLKSACQAGGNLDCDDLEPCTVDACHSKGGCGHDTALKEGQKCSDGSLCTVKDACLQGKCTGVAIVCDDGNLCTTDDCDVDLACTHLPATPTACDDGDACTVGDGCKGGVCSGGTPKTCDDANTCTMDFCDPLQACLHLAISGPDCSDGSVCTEVDFCVGGMCVGTNPLPCDDKKPCTTDVCDPLLGCQHVDADGEACQDGSGCTTGDMCEAGVCVAGTPVNCDDGNVCTKDGCDPVVVCTHAILDAVVCDDGLACTVGDLCSSGTCKGTPLLWNKTASFGDGAALSEEAYGSVALWTDEVAVVGRAGAAGYVAVIKPDGSTSWVQTLSEPGKETVAKAVAERDTYTLEIVGYSTAGNFSTPTVWTIFAETAVVKFAFPMPESTVLNAYGAPPTDTNYWGYLAGTTTHADSSTSGFVAGWNGSDKLYWSKQVNIGTISTSFLAAARTPDGNVVVAGTADDGFGVRVALATLDTGGTVLTTIKTGVGATATSVARLTTGDFAVGASYRGNCYQWICLFAPGALTVTPSGSVIWAAQLADYDYGGATTWLRARPDGSFVGGGVLGSGSFVLRATPTAGMRDFVPIAGDGWANTGAVVSGGRIAVAGQGPNGVDSFLARVDPWGGGTCQDSGACFGAAYTLCDDTNPCSADLCSAGACNHPALADGLPCGQGHSCEAGICK